MATDPEKERMRLQLKKLIEDWNSNRLDLFALSEPNEDLEFHGVMRFFFQDSGQKVATKCIRVSSTATTRAVVEALIEKFHPDLKMLTSPSYSLWEVHESGGERKLAMDEKPLLVQLNWHKDDREGRFLLKREGEKTVLKATENSDPQMKRKLSKRDKKEQKRKEKEMLRAREAEDVASKLYAEVPNTNFTRTISNPEIVMKKRRERKLEQKLKDMGEGGSLKIYGEELSESKPYVTLLVSIKDRAEKIVKETLEKYGLDWHDPSEYCLIEIRASSSEDQKIQNITPVERVLDDDDCPLLLLANEGMKSSITFHVRKKSVEMLRLKRRKSRPSTSDQNSVKNEIQTKYLPCLIVINDDPNYGGQSNKVISIQPNVTEVGNDPILASSGSGLYLQGPNVHPRHCVLAFMDGVVTITPCSPNAEIMVNEKPVAETTILRNGYTIRIGRANLFRFIFNNLDQNANNTFGLNDDSVSLNRSYSASTRNSHQLFTHNNGGDGCDDHVSQIIANALRPLSTTSAPARNHRAGSMSALYETTFDVDGQIQTVHNVGFDPDTERRMIPSESALQQSQLMPQKQQNRSMGSVSMPPTLGHQHGGSLPRPTTLLGRDTIPAIIELLDNAEQDFIATVVRDVQTERVNFKLSPAYAVYMCCRYRCSPHYRVGASPEERGHRLADFLTKLTNVLHVTIQDHCHEANALAFWMGNCSEILNFLKLDHDIRRWTAPEPQESLSEAVQKAFDHLSACFKQDLHASMPLMLELNVDDQTASNQCLHMLSGAMAVLRICRVNPALTIQIFSQLFHYVNMYLFNWLVSREGGSYCCRSWGVHLSRRLSYIQIWAEKQGLELAAECRMERVLQAAKLLQASKIIDNLAPLSASCPKLNSFQLRSLLERYRPELGEPPVAKELIENMVKIAEGQVDELLKSEGQFVHVEEDLDLQLPFLLPDDGYSPDVVRGLAPGLKEFVEVLLSRGLCRMILQPSSSGLWTVHMGSTGEGPFTPQMMPKTSQPEIEVISFEKGNGGIGLSIVQAQGQGQREAGIYIKKVVPNSAAFRDGRLQSGDQLLKVNGNSLLGISQDQAAQFMARSGSVVTFEVAKAAALHNGLATWIYASNSDLDSPSRFTPTAAPPVGDSRVRSVEQLTHHHQQHGLMQIQPSHVSPRISRQTSLASEHQHQPTQPISVEHVRYPSSSSLQPNAYPQQQQQHHVIQQQHVVHSSNSSVRNRSMSATNLKEDHATPPIAAPPPPAYGAQRQQYGGGSSNVSTPPAIPSHLHKPNLPSYNYQHQPVVYDENYYQNIGQYQQQHPPAASPQPIHYLQNDGLLSNSANNVVKRTTPTPVDNSPMSRRSRENSWHQHPSANIPAKNGQAPASAYTNQEYHQLPQYGALRPNASQRSPHNSTLNASAQSLSLSAVITPVSNDLVFAYPSPSSSVQGALRAQTYHNGYHSNDGSSAVWQPQLQNNFDTQAPPAYVNGVGPSYYGQRASPNFFAKNAAYTNNNNNAFNNNIQNPYSDSSQRSSLMTSSTLQMQQQQPSIDTRRLSNTSQSSPNRISPPSRAATAAPPAGANPWEQTNKEEYTKQIEREVERLMSEEIARLESREFLTADEQKRYTALRFELEYRRRLHSADDDSSAMTSSLPVESVESTLDAQRAFDVAMTQQKRLMELDENLEREMADNEVERQQRLQRQLEMLDDSATKRQQLRDVYFVEAERKLQESAVRQKKQQTDIETERHVEAEQQKRLLREQEDERKRHMADLNAHRLSSQVQQIGLDERVVAQRTNGHHPQVSPNRQPQHGKPPPPEVPPKRRVQFDEASSSLADSHIHSTGHAMPQHHQNHHQVAPPPPPVPYELRDEAPSMPPPAAPPITLHKSEFTEVVQSQSFVGLVNSSEMQPKKYVYQNAEAELPRAQVIGGQEVYRDPRQERLKHLQAHHRNVEGEKLSFKDKMLLFAKEVGEQTPKDRLKASSAQREIEQTMNVPTVG